MNKQKKMPIGKVALAAAKVVDAVEKGIELQMIKFVGSDCFIFPEMLKSVKEPKNYIKNLRYYARLKNLIKEDQTLFVKNIETSEQLGFCRSGGQTNCYL